MRLNRRFAPELYLDVVPITSGANGVRIGGDGEVIEHAVCMRAVRSRPISWISCSNAATSRLEEMAAFGRRLGAIHEGAAPCRCGGRVVRALRQRSKPVCWKTFASALQRGRSRLSTQEEIRALAAAIRCASLDCTRGLDGCLVAKPDECASVMAICIRGNVARYGGRLIAFDCLEFEPAFRWIDVADEIAFLYMDVFAESHLAHATAFLNGWLAQTGDFGACRLAQALCGQSGGRAREGRGDSAGSRATCRYVRMARGFLSRTHRHASCSCADFPVPENPGSRRDWRRSWAVLVPLRCRAQANGWASRKAPRLHRACSRACTPQIATANLYAAPGRMRARSTGTAA